MLINHEELAKEQAEMRERMKAKRSRKLPRITHRVRKRWIADLAAKGETLPPLKPGTKEVVINNKVYTTERAAGIGIRRQQYGNKAVHQFEKEFGRDNIINVLSIAQAQDLRMKRLLDMMLDPHEAKCTFATLCIKANITLMEFLEFSKNGHHALAVATAARHAPAVLNDIAIDSMNRMRKCHKCKGSGTIDDAMCEECDGDGVIRVSGDKDARDQFLEATGIVSRKGSSTSIAFNLQNINANIAGMNPFESTIARAQKALDE